MKITETTIITRANTSINWPSEGVPNDSSNPSGDRTGLYFNYTQDISQDNLTRTVTRVYSNVDSFALVRSYSNTSVEEAYQRNLATVGLSLTKTVVTTAE